MHALMLNLKKRVHTFRTKISYPTKNYIHMKKCSTREGTTFRERKRTRVSCEECGETMADSSLQNHMDRAHGKVLTKARGMDVSGGGLEVYKMSFTWILKSVDFLVEGLPAKAKPWEG